MAYQLTVILKTEFKDDLGPSLEVIQESMERTNKMEGKYEQIDNEPVTGTWKIEQVAE